MATTTEVTTEKGISQLSYWPVRHGVLLRPAPRTDDDGAMHGEETRLDVDVVGQGPGAAGEGVVVPPLPEFYKLPFIANLLDAPAPIDIIQELFNDLSKEASVLQRDVQRWNGWSEERQAAWAALRARRG